MLLLLCVSWLYFFILAKLPINWSGKSILLLFQWCSPLHQKCTELQILISSIKDKFWLSNTFDLQEWMMQRYWEIQKVLLVFYLCTPLLLAFFTFIFRCCSICRFFSTYPCQWVINQSVAHPICVSRVFIDYKMLYVFWKVCQRVFHLTNHFESVS